MAGLQGISGVQGGGHGGSNMHRLLGLDTMPHLPLPVLPGTGNAGATAPSLWQPAPRAIPTPPHMDSQFGMGSLGGGQHDVLSSLGLKLPPPSSSPAASYYSDQLHAVVSSAAGRPHEYETSCDVSLPCTTSVTSLPPAALASATVGLDLPAPAGLPPRARDAVLEQPGGYVPFEARDGGDRDSDQPYPNAGCSQVHRGEKAEARY
ncbi:hypothetical protein U9M48_010051 [Paspalum notatum var. saurae]|uniref:Uncharacterized protein n=1 Tax=Paspalum notatum var. saurae TaxID=547442 RepID=A0AAQ3SSB2_PASNO